MVLVQNVSKHYRLYDKPSDRLAELLPFRRAHRYRDFWAVRDLSFHVEPGEILGIVGPNGSGKSTILQLVTGILRPTSGRISVEGRVAALLELGAGFNPDFSGRENVYLNGEIMGLPRTEMDRLFPTIEEFAGIGQFIDRPVKEYSSGMYVRLAFSTAIHVDPEVLIVDEALAVGDAVFANRCIKKLDELKERAVTILFVSHDLGLVKRLCHRALLMHAGEKIFEGTPRDVVNRYVALVHDVNTLSKPSGPGTPAAHGDGTSRITEIAIINSEGTATSSLRSGERATIRVQTEFAADCTDPVIGILLRNRLGIDVYGTNTRVENLRLGTFHAGDRLSLHFHFPCLLTRNDYTLTVATQHNDGRSQDWRDDALEFTVVDDKEIAGVAHLSTDIEWQRTRG